MAELNDGTLSFEARLELVSNDVKIVRQQLEDIGKSGSAAGSTIDKALTNAMQNVISAMGSSTDVLAGKFGELVSVTQQSSATIQQQLTSIQAKLTEALDTKQSAEGFKEVQQAVKDTGEEVDKSLVPMIEKATKAMKTMVAGFSVQQIITQIGKTRGEFQQLEVAFETMLGSEEKSSKLINELVNTAAKTPFDLKGIADGAKQLLAYGFAAEDVNDTLVMLGNVASGLSIPLNDIVYLYGTTMTQGQLFTQDLRQFMGRGIPLAEELSKQFGVAKNEVGDLVTAGKVGFNEVATAMKAMTSEGGQFYNLMDKQSKTISGLTSNLGDAIDTMMNEIGTKTQDVFAAVIKVGIDAVENYKAVGKAIVELASVIGTYKAIMVTVNLLQMANNKLVAEAAVVMRANAAAGTEMSRAQVIAAAKTNILTAAQNKLTAAMRASLMANPYALLAAGITTMTFVLYKMVPYQTQAEKSMKEMNKASAEASANAQVEISKLDALIGKLKGCKEGTEEYNNTKKEIVDNFGKYDSTLNQENASVLLLKDNYKKLAAAIVSSVKSRAMMNEYNRQMEGIEQQTAQMITKLKKGLVSKFGEEIGNELHQKIITGLSLEDVTKEAYAVGRGYATRMGKNTNLLTSETKEMKIAVNGLTEDELKMASAFIFLQEQIYGAFQRAKGLKTELEETFGQKFEVQTNVETGSTTGDGDSGGDSGGDDEDEAKKAEEQRKKQIKAYEKAIAEAIWQSEINLAQAQINAMKDGELKTERQLDLNLQRRLLVIKQQEKKWKEENKKLYKTENLNEEQQKALNMMYSSAYLEFSTATQDAEKRQDEDTKKKLEERLKIWEDFGKKYSELVKKNQEKNERLEDSEDFTDEQKKDMREQLKLEKDADVNLLIAEMGINDEDIANKLIGIINNALEIAADKSIAALKNELANVETQINTLAAADSLSDEQEEKLRNLQARADGLRLAISNADAAFLKVKKDSDKTGKKIKDRMMLAARSIDSLNEAISAVRNQFGEMFSEVTNDALDMVQTMLSSTSGVLQTLQATSVASFKAMSTAEKASVIFTIIQAAIQVTMAMIKLLSNFTKNAQIQKQIDALAENVERLENAYEKATFAHRKLVGGAKYNQSIRDAELLKDALNGVREEIKLTQQQIENAGTKKSRKKYEDNLQALEEKERQMIERIESVYDNFYNAVIGTDSKQFASSLTDALMEGFDAGMSQLDSIFEDTLNDMLRTLIQSQLQQELWSYYDPILKSFQERFGSDKSQVTHADIVALVSEFNGVQDQVNATVEVYRQLYDAMHLNTGDLAASANALQGMTQDTAEELNGRFTALQMSGASIDLKMDRLQATLQQINGLNSGLLDSVSLAVGLASDQLSVLEDIRTYTRKLNDIESHLGRVASQMSAITGAE